jgi:MFS family permease
VVFLVFDLPLRILGLDLPALAVYGAWVALPCVAAAFVLIGRRYAAEDPARWLVLLLAWSSAVPLLYVIAQHMVDAWQLLFVSASLFLFTGSVRQQRFAGVPLAAATLTKLLPGLLLVYLVVRSWRTAALGFVGIGVLLAIGQVLYGPLMGFGYPLLMLGNGGDTIARWSTHFENNSVRGLVFKLADGFRLQDSSSTYLLDARLVPALNVLAYAISAMLLCYLLFAGWRGRRSDSRERRSIEFSLALVTMLLISPHTAQDYLVIMLPVLAVWLFLWARGVPRAWSLGQSVLGAVAALLIGVFVPMNFAARALPINWLLNVSGNAHNGLFVDQAGPAIGAYEFFGFPGLGLILAWLLLVRLERQSR